jgi:23S rRNA pseudouridine1911/1915/1917 synthase
MTSGFYNNAAPARVVPMTEQRSAILSAELAGLRLDAALARVFGEYSRSQLSQWLREGALTVDGRQPKPRTTVQGGEDVRLTIPGAPEPESQAEDIALDVVHADAAIIVINKPAGLVVHPAAGHRSGTLVNALLHLAPELSALPRAGIVHRLDKETTGLLVVARTPAAQTSLVRQLQQRSVHREYRALVQGLPISGGTIDLPIGRHPVDRKRMAVVSGGRPAVSHYRILTRLRAHTLLGVHLETGRTHQIRVHLAHIGHPVVGDRTYGANAVRGISGPDRPWAVELARRTPRQFLHAAELRFEHPRTGVALRFEAPLPPDLAAAAAWAAAGWSRR